MGLILDTNILIDLERGRLSRRQFATLADEEPVYVSAITVAELLAGVEIAEDPQVRVQRRRFVEEVLAGIAVISFGQQEAEVYAGLYASAIKQGKRAGTNVHDLQIAATAIASGMQLLTVNHRDFAHIPGLRLHSLP